MSAPPQHPFRLAAKPHDRSLGLCACGHGPADHPQDPARMPDQEREFVEAACRGYFDPADLIEFAHERAEPGPLRGGARRNWAYEAAQELADCMNYLVWSQLTDDMASEGFADRQELRVAALRDLAVLFSRVQELREC
jgi:hypothetical protein